MKKKILYLSLTLLQSQTIQAAVCDELLLNPLYLTGKTFFHPRSQNTNTVRRAVGQHDFRHRFECDSYNGTFSIIPQYSQSFKPYHIAEYFFGTDTLLFSGSQVTFRGPHNILADYFGLSTEFESALRIKPQIDTFLLDFDLFFGLDQLREGLFFQAYTPLVRTNWKLCLAEAIEATGVCTNFPARYMDEPQVTPAVASATRALQGGITWGDVTEGIQCGKFCCEQKETKLADVTLALGYVFLNRENGYVGTKVFTTIPTGTRASGKYFFEPVIGNGHHWELGVGFMGRGLIWEKDGEQEVWFHFDADFTHLFKSCQCRSFDFCRNCWGSRYILLKEFDNTGAYTGHLVPAINVTTLKCKVSIDFQADVNLMFAYLNKNWEFDFGYNAWVRSHEKICLVDSIERNRYGLKGIQNVDGLNAPSTESCATIYGNYLALQDQVADKNPVFISTEDLDICSASSPLSITHKLYAHVDYAWEDCDRRITPYVGGGGSVEFESIKPRCSLPYRNTLQQWALWLKTGFAFR